MVVGIVGSLVGQFGDAIFLFLFYFLIFNFFETMQNKTT